MAGIVKITRPLYTIDEFEKKYGEHKKRKTSILGYMKKSCTLLRIVKLLLSYVPIVKVIRKYRFKTNIVSDMMAGLTVSFIHLPQGLAFGLLASLQPIYGLYSTFFPVLFYMIFGTSPYISYGPTANMAILTRTVVEREASYFITNYDSKLNFSFNATDVGPSEAEILQVKVDTAASCSIMSGLFLFILGFFRLGFLTSYLSTSFVGGFTTAAAVFVASSQVPKLFGIKIQSYSGAGGLVLSYIDLFRNIGETKLVELLISVICIAILLFVKLCVNERYRSKLKIPIPIDFILAVVATIISYFAKLEDQFDVVTVGPIPSGFIAPSFPKLANVTRYLPDAVVMAIVSLAMTITFATLTAKRHGVKIDESQELFAYGASNIFSGFFGCFPSANASPRTMVLGALGAKTTLNGFATVTVFLLIILIVGKLFIYLPSAVLASMIIVSTKDLILQYRNLPYIWKINKYDFIIWTITNFAAVFIDLYYGLLFGLLFSILLIIVQNQMASGYLINVSLSEDVLYPVDHQSQSEISNNIKIFKFPTSLYFATAEQFKKQIYKLVFNPDSYLKRQRKLQYVKRKSNGSLNPAFESDAESNGEIPIGSINTSSINKPDSIIIDCSMISYMDLAGRNILQEITEQYKNLDIAVYITGVSKFSLRVLNKSDFFKTFSKSNLCLDVFDAMELIKTTQSVVCHL